MGNFKFIGKVTGTKVSLFTYQDEDGNPKIGYTEQNFNPERFVAKSTEKRIDFFIPSSRGKVKVMVGQLLNIDVDTSFFAGFTEEQTLVLFMNTDLESGKEVLCNKIPVKVLARKFCVR